MEVIGIILLIGIFCLGLVICYFFIQYLGAMREVEKKQEDTRSKLSQILNRIEELGKNQSGDEIEKVEQ
jgi:cytochrome c biogenesis protein CcdA